MKTHPSRRSFIVGLLGSSIAVAGAYSRAAAEVMRKGLMLGVSGHTVANKRPLPPFTVERFANTHSLRCLVLGDWGAGSGLQRTVAAGMARYAEAEQPNWIISTGDNFYPIGVSSAADNQFRTKWKNIYNTASLRLPWYVALGNHDYGDNPEAQVEYSSKDADWIMPSRYYSVVKTLKSDHSKLSPISVELFVLDTQALLKGTSKERELQCAWLDKQLAAGSATWRVVVGHHMIRSHGAYGDQAFMLSLVKPLLDKHGVHLYLNGHDHDIQYIKRPEDTFACITSGAGGGARDTAFGEYTRYAATDGGFVALAFTDTRIHAQFCDARGAVCYAQDVAVRA
ncbi:MAG: hypothetical protein RL156_72 [Bacteroidota bacterium]|jgi:acid phosphatase